MAGARAEFSEGAQDARPNGRADGPRAPSQPPPRPRLRMAALLIAAMTAAPLAAGAEPADSTARVTYLAGASVYVDAGERAGLRIGDTLQVVRDGTVVSRLRVEYLSSANASCRALGGAVRPGDRVRFVAHAAPEPALAPDRADAAADAAPVPAARPRRESRIRGRLGARYLASSSGAPATTSFSQPSLDARIDGRGLLASRLDFTVDARARRTYLPDTTGADDRLRVYRMSAALHTRKGGARLTVGRQFSTALSSVSLFDGAQLEGERGRFGAGAFAGTQPGVEDFGWSSAVREAGAFVRLRQPARAVHPWSVTIGGITSMEGGEVNRDYLVVEGSITRARTSALLTQEVDWNRGWRAAGQPTVSPTSTYAVLRAQVRRDLSLDAGYDNRSSVRLYRDRVTPLTEFDDRHRQGMWAGASASLPRGVRVRLDTRVSGDGIEGWASAHSASAEAPVRSRLGLVLRARTTRYAQQRTSGWLHSAGASAQLGALASVELSGGLRQEHDALDPLLDSSSGWLGVDADLHIARRLYLLLSVESDHGGAQSYNQQYLSMSYRF